MKRSSEWKQARLIVTSGLIGAMIGAVINNLYQEFTWKTMIGLIIFLYVIEYFLRNDIKYNESK